MVGTTESPQSPGSPRKLARSLNAPGYVRRPGDGIDTDGTSRQVGFRTRGDAGVVSFDDPAGSAERLELLGIDWDWAGIDLDVMGDGGARSTSPVDRSLARFRANLPVIVWDAARLEGNNVTLPEVQTLLDGVTVEGQRLEDQQQVLSLGEAYNALDGMVADGTFTLTKATSDRLHGIVARHEAIEAGNFRGEGDVNGGGSVRLSTGGVVDGREHGDSGELLIAAYHDLLDYLDAIQDPRQKALIYAAAVTRHQLYFDGNKRTAKLMASGVLMSAGFDAISVPYARLYEQNVSLDRLFSTNNATSYMRLLADCAR